MVTEWACGIIAADQQHRESRSKILCNSDGLRELVLSQAVKSGSVRLLCGNTHLCHVYAARYNSVD